MIDDDDDDFSLEIKTNACAHMKIGNGIVSCLA